MRGVRWLDTASVHLTLRFLGESTYAQIESLKAGLPALACATNRIEGRRLAIWPNRVRPRLLVLELEASDGLLALARECEALAREAGFPPEPRRFKPHMTLARLRPGCAPGVLPPTSLAITFDAVALVQSMLAHPAATYRELARVPLAAPAHDAEDHGQSGHG